METLIFKIETQADDSGVRQYDKSLCGLDVSSKKASGALKSFSKGLLEAKSGADVAAAGAESLSRVLEKSLAGAVVVGGIKIISDQINKMSEVLRSSGEAASSAINQLERMGEIKGIDDATRAVGILNSSIDTTTKNLGAIRDGNWFTQITASITGTTEELNKLLKSQEYLRDVTIASGFAAERNNLEMMSRLNEEQKKYEAIQQALKKKLEIADQIQNAEAKAFAKNEANAIAGIETINLTSSLMAEQSKKEEEASKQRQKEIDAQIKKEQELAATQQKRFNDLYNAEVKAQEETQKRIDANLKAEQDLADKRQSLQQDLGTAKAEQQIRNAGAAQETAASMTGGSASRGAGQRETSYETGLRNSIARAEQRGRTSAADAQMQRTIDQIKSERAATGDTRFTGKTDAMNRMQEEAVKASKAQGAASSGTEQMAQSVADAEQAISDFSQNTQAGSGASESFSSNLSDLGTGFDGAMNNASNFADSMTENGGSMVEDFLNTGDKASNLGDDFSDLGKSAGDLAEKLKKSGGGDGGAGAKPSQDKGAGSLASIEKLLQKNFDELKAYAHAT